MTKAGNSQIMRTITLLITIFSLSLPSNAKYSGGTGEPNDPYQIATAENLMLLGETPEDYDKHFILTADIDLSAFDGKEGRSAFTIIGDSEERGVAVNVGGVYLSGSPFTGVFDGNGHIISHLTAVNAQNTCRGLFGGLASSGQILNLGVVDVNVTSSDGPVGGLVAYNHGTVIRCYSTGTVTGQWEVGGLVGSNLGSIVASYSTGSVSGREEVGGLVGFNWEDFVAFGRSYYLSQGRVSQCYSASSVSGSRAVGGLIGLIESGGAVTDCYSTGSASGDSYVGGLVGENWGDVTQCYSTGMVGGVSHVGGLLGWSSVSIPFSPAVRHSVWDMQTSSLSGSNGGVGLTTAEMMDPNMLGLNGFANDPNWVMDAGQDYPRLAWERTPGGMVSEPDIDWLEGLGTAEKPHRIDTAEQLMLLGKASVLWDRHFILGADIDLDPALPGRCRFGQAFIPVFMGSFDGKCHKISRLTIRGDSYLGLFGKLGSAVNVSNLVLEAVDVNGTGSYMGSLVGYNLGSIATSCSTGVVSCAGEWSGVGGLVGVNVGTVTDCYNTGAVSGHSYVGGLVGYNDWAADITTSYSTGTVIGAERVGGLVGSNGNAWGTDGSVRLSFWDIETSGQTWSDGGTGKTTAEMQTTNTFLEAGWDFVDETANGTEDIWKITEGVGYPRLSWEKYSGGTGEPNDPYQIATADDLMLLGETPEDYDKHFILTADIDLSAFDGKDGRPAFTIIGDTYAASIQVGAGGIRAGGTPFRGVFDGNGHTISHLTAVNAKHPCRGLFGGLARGGQIVNLRVVDVNLTSTDGPIGALVGLSEGTLTRCSSSGTVTGVSSVGGLVGHNTAYWDIRGGVEGRVSQCHTACRVKGVNYVGGLVGSHEGSMTQCHSTGEVSGTGWDTGGLAGACRGSVTHCYSTGAVSGSSGVGGLLGYGWPTQCYSTGEVSGNSFVGGLVGSGSPTQCYSTGAVSGDTYVGGLVGDGTQATVCFWDTQTSGQVESAGGTGKTTAEMQTAATFLEAGWDFVDETTNGTEDIWWILEGQDYPRLWWEESDL